MPRPTSGPQCPKPERLEELIEFLTNLKQSPTEGANQSAITRFNNQLQEAVEALDYTLFGIHQRRGWSKKFQLKDRAIRRILRERVGDDEISLVRNQASQEAEDELFEEASNGEPEPDDIPPSR